MAQVYGFAQCYLLGASEMSHKSPRHNEHEAARRDEGTATNRRRPTKAELDAHTLCLKNYNPMHGPNAQESAQWISRWRASLHARAANSTSTRRISARSRGRRISRAVGRRMDVHAKAVGQSEEIRRSILAFTSLHDDSSSNNWVELVCEWLLPIMYEKVLCAAGANEREDKGR